MAPLVAILGALRKAVQRDLGSLESLKVNNFVLFVALLVAGALQSGQPPKSAYIFFFLFGFLLLFPISADPLARIPKDRLALWPLSPTQRVVLRLSSLLLSPLLWVALIIAWRTGRLSEGLTFLGFALVVRASSVLGKQLANRQRHFHLLRYIPQFPGAIGGLIRKDIRQLLSLLDPYVALALSVGGAAFRISGRNTDPMAFPMLGILVTLAISTYAQSLFGLDLRSGMTRYRLLPLRGWQVLLAKDIAFMVVLLVLLLPLDPVPGITFGLAALAIGHHSSVFLRIPQQRWRFTGGRLLPVGALQLFGGVAIGFAETQRGPIVLALAAVLFVASLFWYGHCWDHMTG